MESILVTNRESFVKGDNMWKPVERLLGKESLITMPYGDTWRAKKKEALDKLKEITEDQIKQIVAPHLEGLPNVVNIATLARKITGNVIMSLYDTQLSEEDCKLLPEAMELLNTQLIGSFLPYWLKFAIPGKGRFDFVCNKIGDILGGAKRDEIVTMFVAGTDTTASALTWHIITGETDPNITVRKYPPIWFFPRIVDKDIELFDHYFSKGDLVILLPIVHGCFPFGGGARKCVGEKLALMEIEVISKLLRDKYDITFIGDSALTSSVTLWPKDARTRLKLK
jgi:cytochrome P450